MRDCRYKKTEEKLLSVFFDARYDTMEQIAKRAGVTRSTIYTHHRSVMKILPDWEAYILEEYRLFLRRRDYLEMLVFILNYQKYFEVFLKFGDRGIIMKIIFEVLGIQEPEKVLKIMASEIAEIIFEWGEKGFSKDEIEMVLADIVYISNTAKERLKPIK
ncbi:TetR/AcrR family transcriptional regulator [Candidatus Saccharibacteria bacterium]|nr:TetR/AcrR family transcriptional regulator [Candidatus Saccharibacteria bacterium]